MLGHPFTYHVAPVGNVWRVGAPYAGHPSSVHVSREEAVRWAEFLARQNVLARVVVDEERSSEPASTDSRRR